MVTLVNRAKVATATTGTGTLTLGSAESGYQSFADAGVVNSDVVRYVIEDGTAWEIGTGTYSAGTLTRTVLESSNADAALNLTGSAVVYVSATAEDIPAVQELYAENPSSPTAPSATGDNAVAIGTSCSASNSASVVIGGFSIASGNAAFAGGSNAVASGLRSLAIGRTTNATNTCSTALGAGSASNGAQSAGPGAIALGGSYASGTDSFAAAIANNTSSYGATGANSVAIGYQAKASGQYALAVGYQTTATQNSAIAIGFSADATGNSSVAIGSTALASGLESVALGDAESTGNTAVAIGNTAAARGSASYAIGEGAQASGVRGFATGFRTSDNGITGKYAWSGASISGSNDGSSQEGRMVLTIATTDATPIALTTFLTTPSTTNQIILPNNSAYFFSGTIIARQDAASGTGMGAWEIKGAIRREGSAATTTLVKSTIDDFNVPAGWAVALTADTTNGGLAITVTGSAATNIRWVATVSTSEVTY